MFDEEVTRYLQLGLLMCISSFRSLVYLDTKIEKPLGIYVLQKICLLKGMLIKTRSTLNQSPPALCS